MGFRIDSPLSKVAGLLFATVALGYVVIREAWGFRFDAFGGGPVGTALAVLAVLILAILLITTDNAFEG
ncbi:hypothetical protein ACFQMA_19160 [Halosimplex aquaticum]|uniref:Uncharacterized protein n=1 Tax=Halosimplex aquaticum TaxID=3026162 RepID=A0ABD5Y7W8_9EURY|nr:hypothetical protein [Halosimplex aquaticum]